MLVSESQDHKFRIFLFVFLIVGTFTNAHRGLDRHSFVELSDYISGFLYFAFSIIIWYLLRNKKLVFSYFFICIGVVLLMFGFKFPDFPNDPGIYEAGSVKTAQFLTKEIRKKQDRGNSVFENLIEKQYADLLAFDKRD